MLETNGLKILTAYEGDLLTLKLLGRLDTNTSSLLEGAIFQPEREFNRLLLDFEGVDYISSSGLRVLLRAEKAMRQRGGMKLIRVCDPILDIFEITRFSDVLTVE